jgi:hypothetical protein
MAKRLYLQPIAEKDWIPDSEAETCMVCRDTFTCWNRRHHCRYCGFVVCANCSAREYWLQEQRACKSCQQKDKAAQDRAAILSSPALRTVQAVSPAVHYKGRGGGKGGGAPAPGPAAAGGGRGSPLPITASPRIRHSMESLEIMYGQPKKGAKEGKESKSSLSSTPILSAHIPSERKKQMSFGATDVMIVVDPFSTGAVIVGEILSRGVKVIRVLADEYPEHLLNLVLEGIRIEYVGTVQHDGDLEATVGRLQELRKKWKFLGCVPGCETGVLLADALSEALSLRSNGTALSDARRNKYLMNEQVRKAGVPAVLQARASTMEEVNTFIKQFGQSFKLVIKPVASAGTDHVYICRTPDEMRRRFNEIMAGTNIMGKKNPEVVIQQFLEGKEYVVDTISLDGKHKCVAVWEYDKRNCNGHDFVYFGVRLLSGDDPKCQELIRYQFQILDALGIVHGAGHAEIIRTPEPRLVEVGARCHGAEGNWIPLVNKCYGYSQTKVLVDSYLDPEAFHALPQYPIRNGWFAAKCDLVSKTEGKLIAMPRLEELKLLKTYAGHDLMVKIGGKLSKTIDCITTPGSIRLISQDEVELETDFQRIHDLEDDNFFVVEPMPKERSREI